jgi:hypothetical protein
MSDLQIADVQAELSRVKLQRQLASEQFVQDQVILVERQFFAFQKLDKLHNEISVAVKHIQAIQERSSFDRGSYISVKEAALCRALHMVKVRTNEHRVLVQQHNAMVDFMKQVRQYLEHITKERENALLRDINNTMVDFMKRVRQYLAHNTKERENPKSRSQNSVDDDDLSCQTLHTPPPSSFELQRSKAPGLVLGFMEPYV